MNAHRRGGLAELARYCASVVRHGPPTRATLAECLARYRAAGFHAHPSQRWLAQRLGVTTRTIRRWTVSLEADDLLDVTRHRPRQDPTTGRWKRRTNGYRCRFKNSKRGPSDAKPLVAPSGHPCPHEVLSGGRIAAVVPVEAAPDVGPPTAPPFRPGETGAQWARRMMKTAQADLPPRWAQ